jgi:hypothetical protein
MALYLDELQAGIDGFTKQADIFSAGNVNLFPMITSQQKWRYAKDGDKLHLHDGQRVYSFTAPEPSTELDFELHRHGDATDEVFESATTKGTAQVHRADPGSIYLTLHEGKENPTYTLKHVFGTQWRGIPKKKKAVKLADINPSVVAEGFVSALTKKAIDLPGILNRVFHAGMRPGTSQSVLMNGLLGAGAGGLYHGLRQSIYNTPEENAEENDDPRTLLRRVLLPGVGLAGLGALQQNMFPNYYKALEKGQKLDPFN